MLSYTTTASAAAELLAAPGAGRYYMVHGYQIMGQDSAAIVQLRSAATPKATVLTPETGVGGISCPPGSEPYFVAAPNEALNLNTGGATGLVIAVNVQYSIQGAL